MTGVNFAIAETGTLVLVENEGNGRMSSTLPEIFVGRDGNREGDSQARWPT